MRRRQPPPVAPASLPAFFFDPAKVKFDGVVVPAKAGIQKLPRREPDPGPGWMHSGVAFLRRGGAFNSRFQANILGPVL